LFCGVGCFIILFILYVLLSTGFLKCLVLASLDVLYVLNLFAKQLIPDILCPWFVFLYIYIYKVNNKAVPVTGLAGL
jgi:hypothetical protein